MPGNACSQIAEGAAARLFQYPRPVSIEYFLQLAGEEIAWVKGGDEKEVMFAGVVSGKEAMIRRGEREERRILNNPFPHEAKEESS